MKHTIRVTAETPITQEDEVRTLITRCALETLAQEEVEFSALIDVLIVDNDNIREINAAHRSVDEVTDVLSFPLYEFYNGEPEEPLTEDPGTGQVMLGDMVLSFERAQQQAEEFGHSFARECGFLTVHSVLHLLGYDHERDDAARRLMRAREEAVLAALALAREEP